jgi:hypothetical protein
MAARRFPPLCYVEQPATCVVVLDHYLGSLLTFSRDRPRRLVLRLTHSVGSRGKRPTRQATKRELSTDGSLSAAICGRYSCLVGRGLSIL